MLFVLFLLPLTIECGGAVPHLLAIGSKEDSADIVEFGKPTPRYQVGIEHLGTAHSDEHLHLPPSQSMWTVYLTYGDTKSEQVVSKDSSIYLGRVAVTVENPDTIVALAPEVSRKGSLGWIDVMNGDNVVHTGEQLRIKFRFACRKAGESRLLFSLPLVHYDMLEFGVAKECDHAEAIARHSSPFYLTAGSLFWGVIVLFICGCLIFLRRYRSTGFKGFELVPTDEG